MPFDSWEFLSFVRKSRDFSAVTEARGVRPKENGRVSPAVRVAFRGTAADQNSYFRPTCNDHCEMPLVWLSALVGMPYAVAWPNSVPER